jgi:hypothetical protein
VRQQRVAKTQDSEKEKVMKTNRMLTTLRLLVLGVLVAGFNAKPASAQVLQGKFTLKSTTRWGQATLPAGDYSFTLDTGYAVSRFTVSRGTQRVALIPAPLITNNTSGRSEMVLEDGTVREVSLPQIGITLDYPANNPYHRAAPKEPQLAETVLVTAKGASR